jgi:hypothetical protein
MPASRGASTWNRLGDGTSESVVNDVGSAIEAGARSTYYPIQRFELCQRDKIVSHAKNASQVIDTSSGSTFPFPTLRSPLRHLRLKNTKTGRIP